MKKNISTGQLSGTAATGAAAEPGNTAAGSFQAAGSNQDHAAGADHATAAGDHLAAGSNQDQTSPAYYQEIRVYGINPEIAPEDLGYILDLDDAAFQEEAERQGQVWSLPGFQEDFNQDYVSSEFLYIRFITIK